MWGRAVYVLINNNIELAKRALKKDKKNFIATVSCEEKCKSYGW